MHLGWSTVEVIISQGKPFLNENLLEFASVALFFKPLIIIHKLLIINFCTKILATIPLLKLVTLASYTKYCHPRIIAWQRDQSMQLFLYKDSNL